MSEINWWLNSTESTMAVVENTTFQQLTPPSSSSMNVIPDKGGPSRRDIRFTSD